MSRGKLIRWRVRATPPSSNFPDGVPEQWVEAEYEPHELALMGRLRERVANAGDDLEERRRLLNEIDTIHEVKALLGARILPEERTRMVLPEPEQEALFIESSIPELNRARAAWERRRQPPRRVSQKSQEPRVREDGIPVEGDESNEAPF